MAAGKFEVAQGVIDGVNVVFTISAPYVPKTVAVFLNGQLKRKDFDDGWIETNPATGTVTLKEAPLPLDVVQVFYSDATATSDTVEVSPLVGVLTATEDLSGTVLDLLVQGQVNALDEQEARFLETDEFSGTLVASDSLVGVLEVSA